MATPIPKPPITGADLQRPDWTLGEERDHQKLWLDKNENTDPEYLRLVNGILEETAPRHLNSYPNFAPLYHKLATYVGLDPENLILAAGSDGAIRAVFEAYVSPGDV